jgi:hypothetical protein
MPGEGEDEKNGEIKGEREEQKEGGKQEPHYERIT